MLQVWTLIVMQYVPGQWVILCVVGLQASLKRKWEEVGEEKTEAIKAHVKVDLDVKEQEDLAKTDAKTQACLQ